MIKRALLVLSTVFSVFSIACVGAATNPGPTGPGTQWPCGYTGKSCGNGNCCWNDEDCGGGNFNGCPANYCCFNGGDENGALRMSRKPHAQIAESKMPAKR